MPKNINQNRYGSFGTKKLKERKRISRTLIMAITVMIFVLGTGVVIYDKFINKSKKVAQTDAPSEIPDWWYQKYFGKAICDDVECKPDSDPDSDKLTNSQEYYYHSDPLNQRTAGDELTDGELVAAGFDPSKSGRVTFDDAASDENIIGESLLYDTDLQKLIAETNDISKVNLELVEDDQLKVTDTVSSDVYERYFSELNSRINRYFSSKDIEYVKQALESGGNSDVDNIRSKAKLLSEELKHMEVPYVFLTYHKYNIAFYSLLDKILLSPSNDIDGWYNDAQAFLAVQQKMNLEKQLLIKEFGQ